MLPRRSIISCLKRALSGGTYGPAEPQGVETKFRQRAVRVAILGADSACGEGVSLMLKQNPIVSQIHLFGTAKVHGIAADLEHMDTRCKAFAYSGQEGLMESVRVADIVLIVNSDLPVKDATPEDRLRAQGMRLVVLAETCARFSPKAIIVVAVGPVSLTLPLVTAMFKRSPWYSPARIIGSVALVQTRVNSLTARHLGLDPFSVHVPLVGGPDSDTVVPLFSRATPLPLSVQECEMLTERMRNINKEISVVRSAPSCYPLSHPYSEAYALNQFITTLGIGLCGDHKAINAAYVRQNIIATCKHLVTSIRFGPGGVVHNYGLPRLTRFELNTLEKIALLLEKREQFAIDFLSEQDGARPCALEISRKDPSFLESIALA